MSEVQSHRACSLFIPLIQLLPKIFTRFPFLYSLFRFFSHRNPVYVRYAPLSQVHFLLLFKWITKFYPSLSFFNVHPDGCDSPHEGICYLYLIRIGNKRIFDEYFAKFDKAMPPWYQTNHVCLDKGVDVTGLWYTFLPTDIT